MSQWLSFTRTVSAPAATRALDRGIGFARHQTAKPVIISRMLRIDRIGLVLVNDAGDPFHVYGDVDPHRGSHGGRRRPVRGGPADAR